MSAADLFPLGDGAVMCLHPDQVDTVELKGGGFVWTKRRDGHRWRMLRRWVPPYQLVTSTCPDCPAQQWNSMPIGAAFVVQMTPFLFVPEGVAL